MSKQIRRFDETIATDLGLTLSPITMVLKHAVRFPRFLEGWVFAYEHQGLTHYDVVNEWHSVNGMRVKIPRFQSHPVIEERLVKRQYRRWYVWGDGTLFPVQISKVDDLKDNFYFLTDNDPRYQTTTIMTEEAMWLRKKPLAFHNPTIEAHPCLNKLSLKSKQ
jgi:hypothetical protein